jgi:hypothetical protein
MSDDARRRLREMPLDELRRRVDLAVAHIRGLRQGVVVTNGMVLEHVDGGLPVLDREQTNRALNETLEMLPLVRLSPEERAELKPLDDEERRNATDAALEAMLEIDPEVFNEQMREAGLEYTHDDLVRLQEEGEKIRLFGVLQAEVEALLPALTELRSTLGEQAAGALSEALQTAALRKPTGGGGAAN